MKRKNLGLNINIKAAESTPSFVRARSHWKSALLKLSDRKDPWAKFHLDQLPTENAVRHRYNALTKKWKQDKCIVKMDPVSFNRGAMRQCYRL